MPGFELIGKEEYKEIQEKISLLEVVLQSAKDAEKAKYYTQLEDERRKLEEFRKCS